MYFKYKARPCLIAEKKFDSSEILHCTGWYQVSLDLPISYTFRTSLSLADSEENQSILCDARQTKHRFSHLWAPPNVIWPYLPMVAGLPCPVEKQSLLTFALLSPCATKLWPPLPPQLNHCFIYNALPPGSQKPYSFARTTKHNHCAEESQGINSTTAVGGLAGDNHYHRTIV